MSNKMTFREQVEFTNVRELVEWSGETFGENTAYSFKRNPAHGEVVRISYSQFRDDVRALASSLISMGVPGKHCALIAKPSYEWIVTYFAVLSSGAVLVPLDRDWLAEDLADTAAKADAEFLFYESDIADKAGVISEKVSFEQSHIIVLDAEDSFAKLTEEGRSIFAENSDDYLSQPIDPMKMSLLVFTSGTTGKGKGVMLSQNAILSVVSDAIPYIDVGTKTVSVLPLHHTYGSTIMLLGHNMFGCEVYISAGLRYVQKELKEQKPEHLVLVPLYLETFYRKIMSNIKEKGKEKLVMNMLKVSNALRKTGVDQRAKFFGEIRAAFGGEVKTIITGGAPINQEIINFFDGIGISTLNGYGITECAPLIAVNRSKNIVKGSVGNVLNIDTVRISEPNEDGEGEILVKGPNVMLGYYKDPVATSEAFEKGYFKTGDYGKLSKSGILSITGRKKNLIILSNGKNVYPEEIENELAATPGVLDIIVYEGQSRRGIENNAIVAEIYPDNDYFEANGIDDLETHFKGYIDTYNRGAVPYKKIGIIKVRKTEFPKNTLRKIMRFKLDTTID